jgi:hypothetical protein
VAAEAFVKSSLNLLFLLINCHFAFLVIKLCVYHKLTVIACRESVCYTVGMQERSFWLSWAQFLQQWGVSEPVAAFLEALGPLSIVLAQFVYIGEPLLGRSSANFRALAHLLEDREEARQFAAFLREEGSR